MKTGRVEFHVWNNLKKHNWLSLIFAFMLFVSGFIVTIPSAVEADGGWVPYFNDFSIYEPGQKAIIAWNGEEEILILSVDVYGAGSNKALHMVPLPAMPSLQLGNISAFDTINTLIFNRGYLSDEYGDGESESEGEEEGKGIKIEFHDKIGAHNLTVVSINSSIYFVDWVKTFINSQGVENITLPDGIRGIIDHYLNDNINYFAFDVIDINKTMRSVQPIIYKFKSDFLYYPLVISSLIEGSSEINVVTLTPANLPIDISDFSKLGFSRNIGFRISHEELALISPTVSELITTEGYLSFYKDIFPLKELNLDVKSKVMRNVNWYESVYKQIGDQIYFDCNGDNIDDVIFYSETLENIEYEAVRGRLPFNIYKEPYIAAINSVDGSLIWKFNFRQANSTTHQFQNLNCLELLDVNSDGKMEVLISIGTRTRYYYYYEEYEKNSYELIALDASTGGTIWSTILPQDYYYYYNYYYQIHHKIGDIDSDGKLEIVFYTGGNDWTKLHAVNLNDGTILWNYTIDDHGGEDIFDFVIIDIDHDLDQEILLRTDENLMVLSGKTGKAIWKRELYKNEYTVSLNYALLETIHDFDLDGNLDIFVVSYDNYFYLLNGTTGTNIWTQRLVTSRANTYQGWTGGSSVGFYDIDSDGILEIFYFGIDGLVALESNNGTILWQNLTIVPQDDEYYSWYYYYSYPDIFWNFKFCNLDTDDSYEIIYFFGQYIYALDSETGFVKWSKKLTKKYYNSRIFQLDVYDVNDNGLLDVIVAIDDNLTVINGQDGSIIWKRRYNEDEPIFFMLIDTNLDSKSELLVDSQNSISLLNLEDGNVEWNFKGKNFKTPNYFSFENFDTDSGLELLLGDNYGFYVINPVNGNLIWDFPMGDRLTDYYYPTGTSGHSNNILIFSDNRLYSVNPQQMHCALSINPATACPGEEVTVRIYLVYHDTPISGAEIKTSDHSEGGVFSDIDELYPGVYQFKYKTPETNLSSINISFDAYHPSHYGLTETIQIEIKNSSSDPVEHEEDPIHADKNLLSIYASAVPDTIKPGETSTIVFKVTSGSSVVDTDLNITLFDSFMNGSFSAVTPYFGSSDYLTFSYTADKMCNAQSIPIIILASHRDYHEGICIINLNITFLDNGSEIIPEPLPEEEPLEENATSERLSVLITANPNFIMPGSEAAIMIYITAGEHEITGAQVQPFDNNIGGISSKVMEYADGFYSFIYTLPNTVPEHVSNAIIFLYISHDDYFNQLELIKLPIVRDEPESKLLKPNDLTLKLTANPIKIFPGDRTYIVVSIQDTQSILPSMDTTKLKIELSDSNNGGIFGLVEDHDLERMVYVYQSSKMANSTIEITVTLYYGDLEISSEELTLEVIPIQTENDGTNDSKKDTGIINEYLLIILPLVIFVIVFVVSFLLVSRKKPKTSKK